MVPTPGKLYRDSCADYLKKKKLLKAAMRKVKGIKKASLRTGQPL